ncbi:DUF1722 domain-containing protein [Providencia rettgeri]|uniref:DUF1722 domain-containing protein n=1 Tax=Providencia rettgeri TaxID=587 RepID=A0A939NEE8_PRORE|nr:DUF1722 domain-containing protein [Providencia rettgeri]
MFNGNIGDSASRNTEVNALSLCKVISNTKPRRMRKTLLWLINDYLAGITLNRPLEMMKQLLIQYPDNYLIEQVIFEPYPNSCSIRSSLIADKGDVDELQNCIWN